MTTNREGKLRAEWFWVDRWMTSSAWLLPLEARGLYREMLSQAWVRGGHLPASPALVQRLTGATAEEWERSWPLVSRYWIEDGDLIYNETQQGVMAESHDRKLGASALGQLRARGAKRNPDGTFRPSSGGSSGGPAGNGSSAGPACIQPPSPSPSPSPSQEPSPDCEDGCFASLSDPAEPESDDAGILSPKRPAESAEVVAQMWNRICAPAGMAKVRAKTLREGGLLSPFKRALKLESDPEVWEAAFELRAADPHWQGRNDRGWTGCMETFLRKAGTFFDQGAEGTGRTREELLREADGEYAEGAA